MKDLICTPYFSHCWNRAAGFTIGGIHSEVSGRNAQMAEDFTSEDFTSKICPLVNDLRRMEAGQELDGNRFRRDLLTLYAKFQPEDVNPVLDVGLNRELHEEGILQKKYSLNFKNHNPLQDDIGFNIETNIQYNAVSLPGSDFPDTQRILVSDGLPMDQRNSGKCPQSGS
jgi:hypothetical protein